MITKNSSPISVPAEHIFTINIGGLRGRYLHIDNDKSKTLVMFGGQHSSIERMYSLCQLLADDFNVYYIDIPGFGGMDSFYSVNKKPSADNYAHYMYSALKTLKLTSNAEVLTFSLSFQFFFTMLQTYPETQEWYDNSYTLGAFSSSEEFIIAKKKFLLIKLIATIGRLYVPSIIIHRFFVSSIGSKIMNKFSESVGNLDEQNTKEVLLDRFLWEVNDTRTHAQTSLDMFKRDLKGEKINLTLHHLSTPKDQYVDVDKVHKNMAALFMDYKIHNMNIDKHAPSTMVSKDQLIEIIPISILEEMKK